MHIVVIGAGLAGLSAGLNAAGAGRQVTVLEASDRPGGRVRTDEVDGFLLDRGFQILLSAYPEARKLLDYGDLDLKAFSPGAAIRSPTGFHRIGDPLREPFRLLDTLVAPIGSPIDKVRILAFRRAVSSGELAELWQRPETTARRRMEAAGFSATMIERFLGPLFTGITLDPELSGSSRVLEFVFRMLSQGDAVVPAGGMGRISDQLAARLPEGSLRLSSPVAAVEPGKVTLESGEVVAADAVIVATDLDAAAHLTSVETRPWRSVTSVWLAGDEAPPGGPVLTLNGSGSGPINSVAAMSEVSPRYAPAGRSLVVASAPRIEPGLVDGLQRQLIDWYGAVAETWEVVRVDEIHHAQPAQPVGRTRSEAVEVGEGVFLCGDHLTDASINGALGSGRAAARLALSARS